MLMAGASAPAMAQSSIFNNPDNKAYFGARFGAEVTCPGMVSEDGFGVSVYDNGGGLEFGGIYNLPIVANLYVEPGLNLYYNTYSVNKGYLDAIGDGIFETSVKSMSFRKFGMRIPVVAGYHFDFTPDIKAYVFTGPELEIGFTAKDHIKAHKMTMSENLYGKDGGLHRADLLWKIGAGVSYQNYYFGVSGSIGMLNMYSDSYATFHENRVTFSLGYNF